MADNKHKETRRRRRFTEFELDTLKDMGKLIVTARKKNAAFHHDYYHMNAESGCCTKITAIELRRVVIDLYSILDHLCQFLYSHFRKNGEKDNNRNRRKNIRFPYFAGCRNHSYTFSNFTNTASKSVFGIGRTRLREAEVKLLKLLFKVQPAALLINGDSSTAQHQNNDELSDGYCLKILHYLRNIEIHQYIAQVKEETVYWDKSDKRSYTEQNDHRSLKPVAKSLSIQVPGLTDGNLRPMPLLTVVPAMIKSVTEIVMECLEKSGCSLDCEGHRLFSRRIVFWNDDYIAIDGRWYFWEKYYEARFLIDDFPQ